MRLRKTESSVWTRGGLCGSGRGWCIRRGSAARRQWAAMTLAGVVPVPVRRRPSPHEVPMIRPLQESPTESNSTTRVGDDLPELVVWSPSTPSGCI